MTIVTMTPHRNRGRITALFILLLLSASRLRAQSTGPVGDWSGSISVPGNELRVTVHLSSANGSWSGTIDIPQQGAKGLPLTAVAITPPAVSFAISGIPGSPTFAGSLTPDGSSISGSFKHGGGSFPFHLARSGASTGEPDSTMKALAELRDLIPQQMKEWNVPGLAIAIIHHDSVVFVSGFGYRNVDKKLPVNENTLFAIGSATKAFTSLLLGSLVDEGKLAWDKPVINYLPTFHLKDSYATEHMTPRDLMTHVSGLPRHDAMWYNSPLTRRELFDRLQYLEPTADLRARWQYQNLMFMTAGILAEQITGKSWESLVTERIFGPLGMMSSNLTVTALEHDTNAALAYVGDTAAELVPYRNIDQIGPAGAVNSNVSDMARWVRFHLGDGTFDGKRIVSASVLRTLHAPQVVMGGAPQSKELLFNLYAMGWMVQAFRGHRLVHHGGNIDGFTSLISFMPDDDAGVVILTNMNGTELPTALMLTAYERLLGLERADWSGRLRGRVDSAMATMKEEPKDDPGQVKGTHPSHPLKEYVGEFEHPAYGVMTIVMKKDHLRATYNGLSSPLEHFHYDVFKATDVPTLGGLKLQFLTNMRGGIDRVSAPLEPAVDDIVFTRRAPASLRDSSYLSQFIGRYDLKGLTLDVTLEHGVLMTQATGQRKIPLAPTKEMEFDLKDLKGYSIRFTEEKGRISEAIVMQPNGTFVAKRIN